MAHDKKTDFFLHRTQSDIFLKTFRVHSSSFEEGTLELFCVGMGANDVYGALSDLAETVIDIGTAQDTHVRAQ
jgi:hypothetical protein